MITVTDLAGSSLIRLSSEEIVLWERTDSEGQDFRHEIRRIALDISEAQLKEDGEPHPVEIHTHDGITLDSMEAVR